MQKKVLILFEVIQKINKKKILVKNEPNQMKMI